MKQENDLLYWLLKMFNHYIKMSEMSQFTLLLISLNFYNSASIKEINRNILEKSKYDP